MSFNCCVPLMADRTQGCPINSLRLHPQHKQLLVHTRDNVIRLLDLRLASFIQVERCNDLFSALSLIRSTRAPSTSSLRYDRPSVHVARSCLRVRSTR